MIKSVKKLYDNRFMRTEDEVDTFQKSLIEVYGVSHIVIIKDLCKVLEEDTEHMEIMVDIVYCMEKLAELNKKESMLLVLDGISSTLEKAEMWIDMFIARQLPNKESRLGMKESLCLINKDDKEAFIEILRGMAEDNEYFEKYVEDIFVGCVY